MGQKKWQMQKRLSPKAKLKLRIFAPCRERCCFGPMHFWNFGKINQFWSDLSFFSFFAGLNALEIRWKSGWWNTLYLICIKWFSLALALIPIHSYHTLSVCQCCFVCVSGVKMCLITFDLKFVTPLDHFEMTMSKKSNNNNMYTNAFLCYLTNHIEMSASCTEMRMGWGVWVSDSDKLVPFFSMKNYLIRNKRVPIKQLTVIYLEQIIQWIKLSND